MKSVIRSIISLASVLFTTVAFAWNGTGHETIAAIAYRNLSPDVRAKVDTILQEHPKYDEWRAAAEKVSNDEEIISLYVFMQAATWPDDIRRSGNPYDHPNWHFVDYPFTPPTKARNPKSPSPKDDILFGMSRSVEELKNAENGDEERAIYLSWIVHLAGDGHQPLHCVSLVNDDFPAPAGDHGGNSIYIRPAKAGVKLHSFWDGLLGNSKLAATLDEPANNATRIAHDYAESSFPAGKTTSPVQKWTLESYDLAVQYGYLKGQISLASTAKEAGPLPSDYSKNAITVAEKQAALAGYRLAHVINDALTEQ